LFVTNRISTEGVFSPRKRVREPRFTNLRPRPSPGADHHLAE
jgi:hypothetical protein